MPDRYRWLGRSRPHAVGQLTRGQDVGQGRLAAAVNLSVYVVDTLFGVPGADIHVGLQHTTVSGWVDLAEGYTGPDGRFTVWRGSLRVSATFRLELELDRYYTTLGSVPLFPRAIVVFRVGDSGEDLHLTVLVSPNLLVTYRGSADAPV
jgi:5-hydroxyisourate hydrolase